MTPVSFVPIVAAIASSAASTSVACFAAAVIIVASECTTIGSTVAAVIEHSVDDSTECSAAFSTRSSTAKFAFFGSIGFTKVSFGIGTFAERSDCSRCWFLPLSYLMPGFVATAVRFAIITVSLDLSLSSANWQAGAFMFTLTDGPTPG